MVSIGNSKEIKESFDLGMFRLRLSNTIFETRKKNDMSQRELKELAQTTQRIVSDIESGEYNMGVNLLYKVFKALNKPLVVDNVDLITGETIFFAKCYFIDISKKTSETKEFYLEGVNSMQENYSGKLLKTNYNK